VAIHTPFCHQAVIEFALELAFKPRFDALISRPQRRMRGSFTGFL
jgi:hypothetical protein